MKGGKPYELIPKVEEKGPKDGWDGDIVRFNTHCMLPWV